MFSRVSNLFGGSPAGNSATGQLDDVPPGARRVSFEAVPASPIDSGLPLLRMSSGCMDGASSGRVSIKNTFITVEPEDDDEDDDQPAFASRCISAPVGAVSKRVSFTEEDDHTISHAESWPKNLPSNVKAAEPTTDGNESTHDGAGSISSMSSLSRSSVPSALPQMTCPVKNTFVQFDEYDSDEQPVMDRRSMSGPVNLSVPRTEPVFIPLQAGQEQSGQEPKEHESQQDVASSNTQSATSDLSFAPMPRGKPEDASQASLRVKNTFIHVEEDGEEQPEAQRCHSTPVSGGLPAKVIVQGEGAGPESSNEAEVLSGRQAAWNTAGPVKNTFIHFVNDDEDEQPDLQRRCLSGPVGSAMSGPAFIPIQTGQDTEPPPEGAQQEHEIAPEPGGHQASDSPMSLWLGLRQKDETFELSSAQEAPVYSGMPFGGVLRPPLGPLPGYAAPIEPPPGITKANGPEPASAWPGIMAPGTGFQQAVVMPGHPSARPPPPKEPPGAPPPVAPAPVAPAPVLSLTLEALPARCTVLTDGDGAPLSPLNAWLGVPSPKKDDPYLLAPDTHAFPGTRELASRGAAEHPVNCRPCAHNWKPAGCSNGKNCNFCHACDESAFKRCKKDKITKLRDEGVPRRRTERKQEAQAPKRTEALVSATDDRVEALADASGYAPMSDNGRPAIGEQTLLQLHPEQPQLALNELSVNYDGPRACIRWMVDLKGFRDSARGRLSRKFSLHLQGADVPFLLMLNPSESSSKEAMRGATARKARAEAIMQVKCVESSQLPAGFFCVAFAAGNLPQRITEPHDFNEKTVCELPHSDAVWDLAAAAAEPGATRCVISAELFPI